MENWKEELAIGGQTLAEIKIQSDIFQGDSILPLLFLITIMLLNYILREFTESNEFKNYKKSLTTLCS